jgi:hypothetical protein
VALSPVDAALAVLRSFTPQVTRKSSGNRVILEIANADGLAAEEHPFARRLLPALADAGVEVLYAAL